MSSPEPQQVDDLAANVESLRSALEQKNGARDTAYSRSRHLTRFCASAIKAALRSDWDEADSALGEAQAVARSLVIELGTYPDLYHAGYTQDSLKEWVEAECACALISERPLPTPREMGVEPATYLNGLAEAASEMRRYALNLMRTDDLRRAEQVLLTMDEIYGLLVTVDFPDAITRGLRRRVDSLRGVLERTRGDLTMSIRQEKLHKALKSLEDGKAGRIGGR